MRIDVIRKISQMNQERQNVVFSVEGRQVVRVIIRFHRKGRPRDQVRNIFWQSVHVHVDIFHQTVCGGGLRPVGGEAAVLNGLHHGVRIVHRFDFGEGIAVVPAFFAPSATLARRFSHTGKNTVHVVKSDRYMQTDRLTREDFDSEEEFLRWKKWSDENYHEMEKKQHIEDNHTVQLSAEIELMPDRDSSNSESFDDVESLLMQCKDRLTEKQFRRYWMYRIENDGGRNCCKGRCASAEYFKKHPSSRHDLPRIPKN